MLGPTGRNTALASILAVSLLATAAPPASAPASQADDANPLSNRSGAPREQALRRFGGNVLTERAVAEGLAWLAAHQQKNGVWDRERFPELCPADDQCGGAGLDRAGQEMNVGISALAALAFLGAGHTHEHGPYAETLTRAFRYILAQQTPDGTFSPTSQLQMYNDALATLAIAEAAAMTHDPVFERPLRKAVGHLARCQQPGGGWDYTAARTGRHDTSITGWVLMALKSAGAAGVTPPRETIWRILEHFENAIQPDGQVWYADVGTGVQRDQATGQRVQRFGPAMTAVGLYAHSTIGWRPDDPTAVLMARRLLSDPPSYERLTRLDPTGLHSEYYWYYGTLGLFHRGGDDWAAWNAKLKNCILEYQERPVRRDGSHRHTYGSWPAYGLKWGKWGKMGGRIYTTAINVLSLEIYYRYVPAYLSSHGLIGPVELRDYVEGHPVADRRNLIPRIMRFHADTAEPVLLPMLHSDDAPLRLSAAAALAALGSPMARPELVRQRDAALAGQRERLTALIKKLDAAAREQEFGPVTRVSAAAGMILFDTKNRPVYYGETIRIVRGDKTVATARIDRRFTAQHAAAATLLESDRDVRAGDRVELSGTPGIGS